MTTDQPQRRDAVTELIDAWKAGRMIVPFLGAGFSASSGYPLAEQLTDYLLKVKFYIKHGAYREMLLPSSGMPANTFHTSGLSWYLRDFDWPDLNQLSLDLYNYTERRPAPSEQEVALSQRSSYWIDRLVKDFFSTRAPALYENYIQSTTPGTECPISPLHWGLGRWRIRTAVQTLLLEDIYLSDYDVAQALLQSLLTLRFQPHADWSRLLMELSEGHLGLIDALFSRLGRRYTPGPSHILMAQLVRRMGISLTLTINFDPFLEQSLTIEGLRPHVFDVGRDELPPDPTVVQQGLSIVKLHGGAYGFRVGERLDYALDDTTRSLLGSYIPPDALLVVIGFSGRERRMMQLLEYLLSTTTQDLPTGRPRIVWTHKEAPDEQAPPLKAFRDHASRQASSHGDRLLMEPIFDAGDFLLQWYQRATTTFPKSQTRYPALLRRITLPPAPTSGSVAGHTTPVSSSATPAPSPDSQFFMFARESLLGRAPGPSFIEENDNAPALAMSQFVAQPAHRTYSVIWIDLEDHHTVSGVVTEIIDKMRVFDPDLPPLILPLDGPSDVLAVPLSQVPPTDERTIKQTVDKPLRYLRRALRRGRYIIAFDSLEGFGRLHTSHHGLPSGEHISTTTEAHRDHRSSPTDAARLRYRVYQLLCFLKGLFALSDANTDDALFTQIDWLCCISCDEPTPRHYTGPRTTSSLIREVRAQLTQLAKDVERQQHRHSSQEVASPHCLWPIALPSASPINNRPSTTVRFLPGTARLRQFVNALKLTLAQEHAQPSKGRRLFKGACSAAEKLIDQILRRSLASHRKTGAPLLIDGLDAAYLVFAVLRRPRSYAALNALWQEFAVSSLPDHTHDASWSLDEVIRSLGRAPLFVLKPMLGGFYWIPHHLHEWTYKILSERVHWKHVIALDRGFARRAEDPAQRASDMRRLAFLLLVHSRVAYFYYTHAFTSSRDVNVFFEYLYHRVSSLRYAKTLCTLWRTLTSDEWASLAGDAHDIAQGIAVCEGVPVPKGPTPLTLVDCCKLLDVVRLKLLRGFMNAFARERDAVFSAASADTWIAWMAQLEQDCAHIVAGSTHKATPLEAPLIAGALQEHNDALMEAGMSLYLLLLDSRARLLRERRAWRQCVECRITTMLYLIARIGRFPAQLMARAASEERHVLDDQSRDLTAMVVGLEEELVAAQDGATDGDAIAPVLAAAQKIGAWAEKHLRSFVPPQGAGGGPVPLTWDEAFTQLEPVIEAAGAANYSWKTLRVLWHAIKTVVFKNPESKAIVASQLSALLQGSGGHAAWLRLLCDTVVDIAACVRHLRDKGGKAAGRKVLKGIGLELLAEIRVLAHEDLPPGSGDVVRGVELITSGLEREFEYQRLRFDVHWEPLWADCINNCFGKEVNTGRKERMEELLAQIEDELGRVKGITPSGVREFFRRTCQLHILAAHCLAILGRCEKAIAALDEAEGALREGTSIERGLLVSLHVQRADVLMKSADVRLRGVNEDVQMAREAFLTARARLAEAKEVLVRAQALLRDGRRTIGQWRALYASVAQLEIEELLLVLIEVAWHKAWRQTRWKDDVSFLAEVWMRVRRGLEAIQGGWDCSLSPSQVLDKRDVVQSDHDRRVWIGRWAQIMVCSNVAVADYGILQEAAGSGDGSVLVKGCPVTQAIGMRGARRKAERMLATFTDADAFLERWRVLNESCALGVFVEGPQISLCRRLLKRVRRANQARMREVDGDTGSTRGLTSRIMVIEFFEKQFGRASGGNGERHRRMGWDRRFLESLGAP